MTEKRQDAISISTVMDEHAQLIKIVFKDNDRLLKIMRNLFFGFPISKSEKESIVTTFGGHDGLTEAVRRKMVPLFTDSIDLPVGVVADYWLGLEQEVLGAPSPAIYQRVASKTKVFEMLMDAIALLKNPDGKKISLDKMPNLVSDEWQVSLLARSLYIRSIGAGLEMLRQIANMKEETNEEKELRIRKDSTK